MEQLLFRSQVAIVTGAAQGLGEAICRMLVNNGCSVMLFDTNEEKTGAVMQSLNKYNFAEWTYPMRLL